MSSNNFTEATTKALQESLALAVENSHSQLSPFHLASVLLTATPDNTAPLFLSILNKAVADTEIVRRGCARAVVKLPSVNPPPDADSISFSPALGKVIRRASEIMKEKNDTFIAVDHLILALIEEPSIAALIKEAGSTVAAVKSAVVSVRGGKKVDSKGAEENYEALAKYARDLTADAEKGMDPVIGRDDEIRRVIRILSRRTKNNPCLVGPPGVGKTALAELLALRIIARDVPANLIDNRLFSLDIPALHAGASYKGQFEERIKSVIDEVEKSTTPIILFIDEMHLLMAGQGSAGGGVDAANILKPALARGRLRVLGATTEAEFKKYIEKDAAFERRFAVVAVNEPSVPETISILRGIVSRYEAHHGVEILDSALISAATLAHRYLTSRRLPDSAIDLIDEASATVRVTRDSQPEEIDRLERQKLQLEIELTALRREIERNKTTKDESSKMRIEEVQFAISKLQEELDPIAAKYQAEKAQADEIQSAKKKIEELKNKADEATRRYDLATAADLQHYAIPELTARLESLEAAKRATDATASGMAGSIVTSDAIAQVVANWSGIPITSLKVSEKQKLLRLEKILAKSVVGQPEAVKAVCDAIRLSRSGLSDEERPIAGFLFVGSSGVGKTLLAKELSRLLFDSPDAMLRIDASEYSEKHSISRLIGSPPGYVGSEEGGQLTEFVRRKPYCVVLIDEIEKASKEFNQIFLQVLDNGRLTDSRGTVVNFKNTVIIMTSNLGSVFINELPDDGKEIPADVKESVNGSIRAHFAPEFINRIDSIVIFKPLGRAQVRTIVDIRIAEVNKRLKSKNIKLNLDSDAKDYLAAIGYHPTYGARPLNRAIQNELLHPLSRAILEESVLNDEEVVVAFDGKNNRLVVVPNHEAAIGMEVDEDSEMDEDGIEIEEIDD